MRKLGRAGIAFAIMFLIQGAYAHLCSRQPEAPIVTAAQIQSLQSDKSLERRVVVVDVRAEAETDVSIIPGAITQTEFEKTKSQHRGKAVIAYCTVGHRSGKFAKKLRSEGWNAWNYKGSILDWCKNQLPVVSKDGNHTSRVHTYNTRYSVAAGYQAVH